MLPLTQAALLLASCVQAYNIRGAARLWGRDGTFGNSTVAHFNSSTTSPTPSTSSTTLSSTSILTKPSTLSTSSNNTSTTTLKTSNQPTLSLNTTRTTPEATCAGSITYTGSVYPTVFMTVDEGFEVTVTASDASITESATLITPLPACEATVVSAGGSFAPLEATLGTPIATVPVSTVTVQIDLTSSTTTRPETETATSTNEGGTSPEVNSSEGGFPGPAQTGPKPPAVSESVSIIMSTIYASASYTSTVIVTRKTPVPVVAPPTSAPPVFQNSASATQSPGQPATTHQDNPSNGGPPPASNSPGNSGQPASSDAPANGGQPAPTNNPGNGGQPVPSNNPGNEGQPAASNNPAPSQALNSNGASNPSPTPFVGLTTRQGTSTGLANIISSALNSQFTPAQPEQVAPATTVFNVPIGVAASSIQIGTQTVAIPTSGAATVRAGGQLFTIRSSEIIASGTTIDIGALEQAQVSASVAPTRVTAAPGVVLTVQGTTAVIDGTTYRIGEGAKQTAITVSGQRIQFGPSGVVLASTTVAAVAVTPAPMVVESVGHLTFSVDATEVVVKGTTYHIGSGAPTIRTTIDGQSLSIGPGGVGVGSKTTLMPTSVTADQTGSPTASDTASIQSAAASHTSRILHTELLGWLLVTIAGFLL